ncbi:MAG: hypothetical protein KAS71_08160 [Bacteroidales bacterium]|nr:hypothetical protein [Bacteroidales bacterium]
MKRRDFAKLASIGVVAMQSFPAICSAEMFNNEKTKSSKVPLGLCNHSLRSMRLNASQLIEYAIKQKLDSVLLNSFQPYESLEDGYLKTLSDLAKANDISIYIGTGSISKYSAKFSNKYGNAEALLEEGLRVASALDSPIVGCRIGNIEDRYVPVYPFM